jgi:hypothetical protein
MANLPNEMLQAIIVETVDTMPEELLAFYRNPPGRSPHEHVRQIQTAIENIDDPTAKLLIRDVVDGVVFQLLYLIESEFKERRIETIIRQGSVSHELAGSALHESYRERIDPGGAHVTD